MAATPLAKAVLSKARHTLARPTAPPSSYGAISVTDVSEMRQGGPHGGDRPARRDGANSGAVERPRPDAGDETGPARRAEDEHRAGRVLRVADQHGGRHVRDLDAVTGSATASALTPSEIGVLHGRPLPQVNAHPLERITASWDGSRPPFQRWPFGSVLPTMRVPAGHRRHPGRSRPRWTSPGRGRRSAPRCAPPGSGCPRRTPAP